MKIYVDTDDNRLIRSSQYKTSLESLSFMRGDNIQIQLEFVSGFASLSASNDKTIKFGIKQQGLYGDGDYIVYTDEYTISGNSYILNPSFNGTELNNLLNAVDGISGNDLASVTGNLQIEWIVGDVVTSTNIIPVTIQNDIISGNEGTALTQTPSPLEWLSSLMLYLTSNPVNMGEAYDVAFTPPYVYSDGQYVKIPDVGSHVYSYGRPAEGGGYYSQMYFDESSEYWYITGDEGPVALNTRDWGSNPIATPPLTGWVTNLFVEGTDPSVQYTVAVTDLTTPASFKGQLAVVNLSSVFVNVDNPKWIPLN